MSLAPRSARRRTVVAWAVLTVALALTFLLAGTWGAAVLPLWAGSLWALRRVVRSQADLPDDRLDERQVAERDRTYLYAYQGLATVALVVLFAFAIAADRTTITYDHLSGAMWLVLGLSLGLPSAVLAWTAPDAAVDDDVVAGA